MNCRGNCNQGRHPCDSDECADDVYTFIDDLIWTAAWPLLAVFVLIVVFLAAGYYAG